MRKQAIECSRFISSYNFEISSTSCEQNDFVQIGVN